MRPDPKDLRARTSTGAALATAVLAGAIGLAGCAGLKDLARAAFQEPKLVFRNATVDTLDLEGATIALHVDLQNPNGFGLDVARVGWTFEADGTRVASGEMPGGLVIPANGTAPLAIPVRVQWHDVPGIVGLLRRGDDAIPYRVAGHVGVHTPVGVLDLPVSHEGRLPTPRLPTFALEGLRIQGVSFSEVSFEVKVAAKNPNAFPVPGGRLSWTLALGGGPPVARAEGMTLPPMAPRSSGEILVPVRLDFASAGRAARDLARGEDVRVRLTGEAQVAGLPVPFELDAMVPARR